MTHVYREAGGTAVLPCDTSSASSTCSGTTWYFRTTSSYTTEVSLGQVVERSSRASRMSLGPNCSLVLRGVAAEDAGLYNCGQDGYHFTFMSVLQGRLSTAANITSPPPPRAGVHDMVLFFCQSRSIRIHRRRPGSDWNVLCGDLLSWDRVCPTASAGSTGPARCCTVSEPR